MFDSCREIGIAVVMKGKSNFTFLIKGRKVKGRDLCSQMTHAWRSYALESNYCYERYEAISPTLGKVILTIHRSGSVIYYLISSCFNHTSPKMIDDYKLRWSIEVFFHDAKQYVDLGVFRFQSKGKIIAHFVLRSLSYHILDRVRFYKFHRRRTIPQIAKWIADQLLVKKEYILPNLWIQSLNKILY